MIAAGIEGGSKRAVEAEWTLDDVAAQRVHWAEFGPPVHIAVAMFAAAWGVKLTRDPDEMPAAIPAETQANRPSIAALATATQPPVAGGDTLAASLAIMKKMQEGGRG